MVNMMEYILTPCMKNLVDSKIQIENVYNMKSLFRVFLEYYESKVFFNKIVPIEKLTTQEKNQLWEYSGTICSEKEERIKVCKVSYIIDYLVTEIF